MLAHLSVAAQDDPAQDDPAQEEPVIETITPSPPRPSQPQEDAPLTEEETRERFTQSMSYMLRRAKLVRTLAAEHMVHINENGEKPELHLVEEASQVVAYDLVCANGDFDPVVLDQMATDSTYRIALEAGNSPIAKPLADIGQRQSIQARMDLLGDVSSSVFLFQVGRRRGLFDSLITDFGEENFCSGMRSNMRDRYEALRADRAAAEQAGN